MPKIDRHIEKDKKLLARDRKARLVTHLDLKDPEFMEKYPNAQIGQQIFDPKPLFFKIGMKRKPTMEEQHARIAAEIRRDLSREIDLGQEETLIDDDFDDAPQLSAYEAVNAVYGGLPEYNKLAGEVGSAASQKAKETASPSDDQSE